MTKILKTVNIYKIHITFATVTDIFTSIGIISFLHARYQMKISGATVLVWNQLDDPPIL